MTKSTRDRTRAARVVIADDHDLARAGLRGMLEGERNLHIVGEANSGVTLLQVCRETDPDLVLMDVRMPEMDGLTATRLLRAEMPNIAVIVVTMHENPDYLVEALRAGAAGYVLKGATRKELSSAVRQVLAGETLLQPELVAQLLRRVANETRAAAASVDDTLTGREREVLACLARGLTNREIATALVISLSTVKAHVEHIIAKLGVSDRTQAAVRAVQMGIVPARP
jgi:DNA-binding NarL/FixJ family response regulator